MKDDTFTGCGISKLYGTAEDDPFSIACEWHDKAYTKGSWAEYNMSRLQVDRKFLYYMLAISQHSATRRIRAYFFYSMARIFGAKYWEKMRRKQIISGTLSGEYKIH